MKVKCEYCNGYIDESEEKCPTCGAPNKNFKRVANHTPTTIQELAQWYEDHDLPPYEVTRFFIGINNTEAKAFGIYKDESTGKFVVYKNKDTGERKIRYEGKDEKYAVNELYMKLKEEILNQKELNANRSGANNHKSLPFPVMIIYSLLSQVIFMVGASLIILLAAVGTGGPSRGYYNINDHEFYYVNGEWYKYDNGWSSTSEPSYAGDLDDYYDGYDYNGNNSYTDISDSDVYDDSWDTSSSSSDDWDSDSDWDSGDSWDSGGTDWGSDW